VKKKTICLISVTISPDSADGEAKFVRALYEYLKKKGYYVKVLTCKWTRDLKDPNIIQFKVLKRRFLWTVYFYIKTIKYLYSNKFDIIHANSPKAAIPIILSGKKRFITTIHDFTPFETKLTLIPLESLLIKYVAKRSSFIITVSNFIKNKFKYYFPKIDFQKIFVVLSGIEEKFKPYPLKARELRKNLNLQGHILLFIGRITSYKGIEYIIQAYEMAKKKIPNLNLIIGGTPDYLMEKTYEEWKEKYKDIKFVGYIPENEIAYYYSMGDIFITFSSSSEGFGLTPLEAIKCDTPVICSSLPVFKEILGPSAIYVPPKNAKLLADKIIFLLENEEFRQKLLEKARIHAKKYTIEAVGEKVEKVYEKISY